MQPKIISALSLGINQKLVDHSALEVIKSLQSHGYNAYIVGGGVRDLLLKAKPKDFDIVTSATPEQVKRVFFKNSMIIGRRFKIVHVYYDKLNQLRSNKHQKNIFDKQILEVSTFRSNQVHNVDKNDKGRIVSDNNYGTMNEDAFRRDFTINALYYDPVSEEIFDYHNGIQDIQDKTLRIIGKPQSRYIEDPVRIIRAIRIATKLGLEIEDNTIFPFKNLKHLLANEPRGRLFEEMNKILLSGYSKQVIEELNHLGISRKVFPIFSQIFFDNQNEFANRVLERTDERIQNNGDISLVFIYAAMLWQTIKSQAEHYQNEFNMPYVEAFRESVYAIKPTLVNNGLTQHLIQSMREIWFMQANFETPSAKKLEVLMTHKRLRQSWNLFMLRHEFNEVDAELFTWWDNYINNEQADKTALVIELIDKFPQPEPAAKKKKKRKKRKKKVKQDNEQ